MSRAWLRRTLVRRPAAREGLSGGDRVGLTSGDVPAPMSGDVLRPDVR